MEEIKNLFTKHFGFFPDIISTTEHAYISPLSRILSSLIKLSEYKNKKVLRFVITDRYSINPESCVQQICLPHILNKNIFKIGAINSKTGLIQKFNEGVMQFKCILKNQFIFSKQEVSNYNELIIIYEKIFENIQDIDPVAIYNNIIHTYSEIFEFYDLYKWLKENKLFGVDSSESRLFLKEALFILCKNDPVGISLFGDYLEKNKRLKYNDSNNVRQIISWVRYLEELNNIESTCSVPFEIILYVYSYCRGSHFGNDYGMVSDINKMRNNANLIQITKHNKDYNFNIELENIQFQKATFIKEKWTLSHKTYKTINTLPELVIVLGLNDLKNKIKNLSKNSF
jgi:hypothetical protein